MTIAASMRSLGIVAALVCGCEGADVATRPPAPPNTGRDGFANGCYVMDAAAPGSGSSRWLAANTPGDAYGFTASSQGAGARFVMRASDLGTYLLRDATGGYVVGAAHQLTRATQLQSDLELLDDTFRSPAEWNLAVAPTDPTRFQLRNYQTGEYLTVGGTSPTAADAATVAFYPATGCAPFPEMTLDAEGAVAPRAWPDGDLYGIVDAHSHLFSNFGFGGAGMYHGSPFHRLGVEKALPSCEQFHGVDGRRDLIAWAFGGLSDPDPNALLTALVSGRTPEFNHHTEGYPEFTDWPNAWGSPTHQVQYYRWLERAHRAGLRLVVQHATTNSVLCELIAGVRAQPTRYACDDMVAVEREIAEARNLERYIDAQSGGAGRGWLHIVTTPAEARTTIAAGRLAVILGIETSNLFECLLTPRRDTPVCDAARVRAQLDHFHDLGVRALFPVHKFDNAFSAGDGDRRVGQIGSFVNSGHYSNFVLDCPSTPAVFDRGNVLFGGVNRPRAVYDSPPPADMRNFPASPLSTVLPYVNALREPRLTGDYCQNAGLTPLGETLIRQMMLRGMIVEVDHLPRRSIARAYELLAAADYPPTATHGNVMNGRVYDLHGISITGLGRCSDPSRPGAMGDGLRERIALIRAHGGYPAEGFGFDLNGFASAPGPRFGPHSVCRDTPQQHLIRYPFTSYAGDVTFTPPRLGNRTVDFDTEGMLHIGLLPELIEDARRDGVSDAELEPLFRSAEAYVRMWERAEARGAALRQASP
ncbi:MAG: membrane dipeptidase [Deltaproteobacteria bacterium]|nr:membrane dipeptidase [Deltaproteobacteria bacterium]